MPRVLRSRTTRLASGVKILQCEVQRQLVPRQRGSKEDLGAQEYVTILLCTRNGARFVEEQLASISSQTYPHWRLVVSDDGSDDATLDIVRRFAAKLSGCERVTIRRGPSQGATANFLSLASNPEIDGAFFAYCDQDDIWLPDKLERAVTWLGSVPKATPALYCSRTTYIDEVGRAIGSSSRFRRSPSFRNALVQNIAGGNTMVFNPQARMLLVEAGLARVIAHDWWTYVLVTGAGGRVLHDEAPSLLYRQHGNNVIGSRAGMREWLRRLRRLTSGEVANWNCKNIAELRRCVHLLLPENRQVLEWFCEMQSRSLAQRLRGFACAKPYRLTNVGQASLLVGLLTHRL